MSSGLLLAFPLESVVLRLALALGVALILLRIVSSWDLQSPRARSVLAVSPFVVAAAVVLLSSRDLGLPSLLAPSSVDAASLAVPVADRYLDFAPMAPVLVAVWASVSLALLGMRGLQAARFRRQVLRDVGPAEPRIAAVVLRLARRLEVAPPRVLVVEAGVAGAAVIGVRDPILLVDRWVLDALDDVELEGVIAHELAHVARRDNLVAWAVAVVRDVAFFVPGAMWAVRALHREREAAADHDAVRVTGRPAALASGLLQVVERAHDVRQMPHGCAALVPTSSVVDRVRFLLREEQVTAREHRTELALAVAVSLVAIALAVVVPTMLTGQEGQRDALGVLVGPGAELAPEADVVAGAEGRVFSVYRGAGAPQLAAAGQAVAPPVRSFELMGPEDRPGMAAVCATGVAECVARTLRPGLALRPAPIVLLDGSSSFRWQATPVSDAVAGDRIAVYWLSRLDRAVPVG